MAGEEMLSMSVGSMYNASQSNYNVSVNNSTSSNDKLEEIPPKKKNFPNSVFVPNGYASAGACIW